MKEYTTAEKRMMQDYKRPFIEQLNQGDIVKVLGLTKARAHGYICPVCGSGRGPSGTGAEVTKDHRRITCYSTSKDCPLRGVGPDGVAHGQDIFGALKITTGKSENDILREHFPQYDIRKAFEDSAQLRPEPKKNQQPANREDLTDKYREWHAFLLQDKKALAYLESRGITQETAAHFMLGVRPEWTNPARIIIPRTKYDYSARRIDGKEDEAGRKYMIFGRQSLFNAKMIKAAAAEGKPLVVVEGELDGMAVHQAGYEYVTALGTTNNKELFVRRVKDEAPGITVILALDDDGEGHGAQEAMQAAMKEAGLYSIPAGTEALYDGHKDAAGAAKADVEGFAARLMSYIERAWNDQQQRKQQAEAEAYFQSGPGMVDSFLAVCKGEQYRPISTGIKCIDNALCGGLVRQTVVVLGAAPGQGKTALAAQIAENLARAGEDVLFINLEMSREQLLARSLARIINAGGGMRISTAEILRGYSWTIEAEEAVYTAAAEYKEMVAQHLIYNPGEGNTTDISDILGKIQAEKARIGRPPIVFIDYLQLLTSQNNGRDEEPAQTIKRAMYQLKNYAIQENSIVFLITANNRMSMRDGTSDLFSGRDTSAIEFSADVHLGLEYKAIEDGTDIKMIRGAKSRYYDTPTDPQAKQDFQKYCCEMSLRINKNRHGTEGRKAYLYFDGAAATFRPLDQQQPAQDTGRRQYTPQEWENMELLP